MQIWWTSCASYEAKSKTLRAYGRKDRRMTVFSESVWNGVVFYSKKSGKGVKYICLERDSCLYGKGWKTTIAWNGDIINGFLLIIWSARGKWSLVWINVLHSILQFHFIAPLGTPDYYQRMLDSSELYWKVAYNWRRLLSYMALG